MKNFYIPIIVFWATLSLACHALAQQPLVAAEKKAVLEKMSEAQSAVYAVNRQNAFTSAVQKQWPLRMVFKSGNVATLQKLSSLGFPVYYRTFTNTAAAATTRTNTVQPGGALGLNLSGSSSLLNNKLAIWDEGAVYPGHQEFSGKNIILRNAGASIDQHATHVAGTMIAKGTYAPARGMAFGAGTLISYDYDNDIAEITAAASGLLLSNHSYGTLAGWEYNNNLGRWEWYGLPGDTEDYKFGFYDRDAQSLDLVANTAPYYLVVAAAGNSRGITGPSVGTEYFGYNSRTDPAMVSKGPRPAGISSNNGYDVIPGFANAKNILTVGAINQLPYGPSTRQGVSIGYYSSYGPTDDGRIKPDICGDGENVLSTNSNGAASYLTLTGTSMASPNITGSLYLLQEYYAQKNGGAFMRAATLKGLVCHTGFDAGNIGPDYIYGWGVLDMQRAAQAITDRGGNSIISEITLQQGQTQTLNVVASGKGVLAATISWTDPQGAPNTDGTLNARNIKLINDLDIRISDGTTTYASWVLNPDNPSTAATRGDNIRDNIEQVYLDNAVPGRTYTIIVSHKATLQAGTQPYSLIVTGVGGTSYCTSAPQSNADSRIDRFVLSTISNTPAAGCKTYSDFTGMIAQLEPGKTYPVSITAGTCSGSFNKIAKVFIDWNGDGAFNNTDELVTTSTTITATGTYTSNITVPTNVVPGNISLMRVVLSETNDAATINACGSYAKGETQDYRVQFLQAGQDAGVLSVRAYTQSGACAGQANITVRLRNFGTAPISNFPVTVTVANPSGIISTFTETYTGTIAAGSEDDFVLSGTFNSVAGTTYTLTAVTRLTGDPVAGNNQSSSAFTVSGAPVPSNLAAAYCDDTNRYLLSGSGDGQLLWYQSLTGGLPVAVGQPAFTGITPVNNTFYAAINDFSGTVGPASKYVFTGGTYNQFTPEVVVSTKTPVVIQSARLYIGNAGRITFDVANANGQVVATTTINAAATRTSPAPGPLGDDATDQGQVYNLNLLLPAAGTYTISVNYNGGNATLFASNRGVNGYPFKIGDVFSIASNSAYNFNNPNDTAYYKNFYYYFYDMRVISAGCASAARVPVTVTKPVITQNGTVLSSNFSSGNQWYLNDVIIPGATGQTYVPTQNGNYQVRILLATGCTVISPVYVYIRSDGVSNTPNDISLSSYPVPADSELHVVFKAPEANNMTLSLISTSGRLAYKKTESIAAGNYSTIVNVGDLIPGTYILRVLLGQKVYSNKVIIIR